MGNLARLAGLLALTSACVEAGGPAKAVPDAVEDTRVEVVVESVLGFDVHVRPESAEFVRSYAGATDIPVNETDGEVVAGPFLSRFEAQLVAGCAADGFVRMHDAFDEPATPAPFVRVAGRDDRSAVEAGMRRIFGERFALVTWKLSAPREAAVDARPASETSSFERELFSLRGGAPRSIARLPADFALDMPAAGLFVAKVGDAHVFLSPATKDHGEAARSERLVAWRDDALGRSLEFERRLVTFSQPPEGAPTVLVTRVRPEPSLLVLESHRVELAQTEAGAERASLFNDWASPEWVAEPHADLCRLVGAARTGSETISLE